MVTPSFVADAVAPLACRWEGKFHAKDLAPRLPEHFSYAQITSCLMRLARKGVLDALGGGWYRTNHHSEDEAAHREASKARGQEDTQRFIQIALQGAWFELSDAREAAEELAELVESGQISNPSPETLARVEELSDELIDGFESLTRSAGISPEMQQRWKEICRSAPRAPRSAEGSDRA